MALGLSAQVHEGRMVTTSRHSARNEELPNGLRLEDPVIRISCTTRTTGVY